LVYPELVAARLQHLEVALSEDLTVSWTPLESGEWAMEEELDMPVSASMTTRALSWMRTICKDVFQAALTAQVLGDD